MYKVIVDVTLKENVLDPQGAAVKGTLHSLGYLEVNKVRIGKKLEFMLDINDRFQAEKQVEVICHQVLSNPVIEHFTFESKEVK
jgi:phosphoribosylformylglycinamidine synthase